MPSVAFVLTDDMLSTSTTWPADILSAANQAAKQHCKSGQPFEMTTVSESLGAIKCHSGIHLSPAQNLSEIDTIDLIYLPALWRNPQRIIQSNTALIEWLRDQYEKGAIICGVGTGCCFMAETGLLNNKPATTHWYYFDRFQKHYPEVQLKRQYFITQAGRLYCAASINSLADLTIHFTQRFFNQTVANHIQKHFSHEMRKPYESISYFEEHNTNHPDETILQSQLWIQTNYDKQMSIKELASLFDMSERNFNRRFKAAAGKSPLAYLQETRFEIAKDLLQSTNLNISDIAFRVGYNDVSHFSQLFRRHLSMTPSQYRVMVRGKLFTTGN